MSVFHVNYRDRLAEVMQALGAARQEGRQHDAVALEMAAIVLERHLGELERSRPAFA